jgi:hypothetical protein
MSINGKTFRVGGIDYSVEVVPQLYERHQLYGQVTYKDAHIQIDDSLAKDRANETLIHELLHAMLFEAGYYDHDEELVKRLAAVLHQVLRDNDFSFVRGDAVDA